MTFGFVPDSRTQQAHCQSHDPGQSPVFRKLGIRWTGDRDELSPRFEHAERFFERLCAQTIQHHIVILQDVFEIVFPVIDDQICTQALHPLEIRRARGRRADRTKLLGQLNGNCSNTTPATSLPKMSGKQDGKKRLNSPSLILAPSRLTPAAWIWTKTSSSRSTGSGMSPARTPSLLP